MNHREKEGRYEGKRQRRDEGRRQRRKEGRNEGRKEGRDEGRRQRRKEGRKMRSFREESEGREKEIRGREGYALSLQMSIQIVIDKEENIKVHCSYPNRLNINGRFDLAELSHHIIKEINANEINKSNLFDSLSLSLLLSFFPSSSISPFIPSFALFCSLLVFINITITEEREGECVTRLVEILKKFLSFLFLYIPLF